MIRTKTTASVRVLMLMVSMTAALPRAGAQDLTAGSQPANSSAHPRVADALVAFEVGVEATRAARWTEARDAFRRSLSLAPKASTHFNLAVVCVRLGLGDEAIAALDAFDALAQGNGYDGMRAKEPQLRAEAEALRPTAKVELPPAPEEPVARRVAQPARPARLATYEPPQPTEDKPSGRVHAAQRTLIAGGVLGGFALGFGAWAIVRGSRYRHCLDGPGGTECYERTTILHERNGARATTVALGAAAAVVLTVGAIRLGGARGSQLAITAAPRAWGLTLSGSL